MDTEQWLIQQEEHARRAKEAYQLLYEVYLDIGYDDYGNPVINRQLDDKVQRFFTAEEHRKIADWIEGNIKC